MIDPPDETLPDAAMGETSRYEAFEKRAYSAVVSDALDALGAPGRVLDGHIRPVGRLHRPVIGRAATALAVSVHTAPERPYAMLLEAIDLLQRGDVWVIAGEGQATSAIFGGLLATAAGARGAVGCVVDGPVRDTRQLQDLAFPTFARGFSPADSYGRDEIIEHGRPVHSGSVEVHPGELIVADEDGIVAIPAELEAEVIAHALAKLDREKTMRGELEEGLPAAEAFAKYGIL